MVLSKRKRKDNINVPVTPTTNEEPKRTRVQAQRKYAQGQPVPTSVYLAFNSEPPNPVKENSNPPVDVLPNQTPSTEDFIKYICFRNTSMCPKEFDFSEGASTSEGPSTSRATKEEASSKKSAKESTPKTVTKNHENTVDKNPSPKFMAFAARKRAEKFPEKKPQSTSENSNKKKPQNKSGNANKNKSNGNESRCTENSLNENSTTDKEESAKKRLRLKHAHSSSSLNDSSIVKSRKLDKSGESSSHGNLNDVKIVLDKNDVDKEIEKNKSVPNKVSSESKSKKVPVQNDKRNTRLSALRNNSATPTSFEMKKDESNKEEVDFSSDDEKPLISATENRTKLAKNHPGTSLPKTSITKDKKNLSNKSKTETEKETNSKVETPESISDNKPKKRGRKKAQISPAHSPTPEVNAKKPNVSSAENEKPKVGRKKKKTADAEIAELSQANTTDLSENEAKPGRPTRKTKEAATIYMELIGRKLTLHDFSDNDSSSLDSLELPNFRKMELLENELKANASRNKGPEKKENIVEKISAVQTSTPKTGKETVKIESKNSTKQEKESPGKKLDKSFDDSDEEPLAVKLGIDKKPPPKKRGRKSNKEKSEMLAAEALNKTISEKNADKTVDHTKSFDKTNSILPSSNFQSPKTVNSLDVSNAAKVNETFESQKTGKTNENFHVKKEAKNETDEDFMKSFESGNVKPISLVPKSSINLLPSKEESEKIFGIASVTLAQSSGPLDTKCTLGKCGFVHKPPLGPAVLTETALGANLSPKDRRKSKVNMTREQIQKWLDETSWTPIPDELNDDYNEVFDKIQTKSKPSNSSAVTSVTSLKSKDAKDSNNSNDSIPTPSTSKGPTLKAKAVALVPEPTIEKIVNVQTVIDVEPKETEKNKKTDTTKKVTTPTIENKSDKINLDKSMSAETKKSANQAKNDKTASTPKSSLAASDRKPIYNAQQRKTPVYKAMEQKAKSPGALLNAFGAFSADNEHSVYSFDKEDDDIPATTPFRRCSRQESTNSKAEDSQQKKEIFDTFQKPQNLTPGNTTPNKQQISTSQVSLTLSPEESKKSASISVLQSEDVPSTTEKKETAVADKTENDSDSEGHTFYIPLQTTNVSGSKNDQLIQGVAVKLGTEGAEGPNQRIIMHAKLVTKSRIGMSSAPLPESMTNVQELVKTLMAGNKDATTTKPVPCATVQPRFKTNDSFEDSIQQNDSLPSTSAMPNRSKQSISVAKNPCDGEIQPTNNTVFPGANETASMVEAPIFRPTEKEFQDPIEYIEKITPIASRFGICKIIPPESFKPECRVADEMRFTASNQYVHKMLHRWGPSAKEFAAIKKYLATQSIVFQHPPLIAGMEVDLPRLYHTVQELGGLKEVIEKKKWAKVAEDMCIPKSAHDRVTKLDDIYCKYLLPYDTLSHSERQKLFDEVEADWAKREAKARRNADKGVESDDQSNEEEEDESDEDDSSSLECMVKGRSMALSQFFRIARNTMALWFKNNEPSVNEIENEYWRHVAVRDSHVCVHYGSIDSSGFGYGFPSHGPKMKSSPCSKHPWNLKVLTNNTRSVIRSLGPITGVTVPTLHVGMLFSAVCWYRDPHGLPWIEYLHTGANKIWYAVPDEQSSNFRSALTALAPSLCQNKTIWLPCDTVMVPPVMLTDRGVSLCRTEQEPGQFVVVFSRAYTSSLCTGYTVSESVYFATSSWLNTAHEDFMDITESSEPSMFSLEQLILAVANDGRSSTDIVTQILPMLTDLYEKEKKERQKLKDSGVTKMEKVNESRNKALIDELECSCCRANLHTSWIKLLDDDEETIYCLKHALKYINENRIETNQCKLMYTYSVDDIKNLLAKLNTKISTLIQSGELASINSSEPASNSKKKTNAKIKHGIATLIK